MRTGSPASARQPRPQHAVPPHDRAGHKHRRGRQSEYRPDRLGRLIAKPGSAARNADAINAAEMQEGEPINNLIDEAYSVGRSGRIQPVGEILERLRIAEIDSANAKYQYECEAPEADHTVQVPREALPSHARPADVAGQRQTTTPCPDARPPDRKTRHRQCEQGQSADGVDLPARRSGEQIVVQINQPRDDPDTRRDGVPKIGAASRIEQALLTLIATAQPYIYRLIGISSPADFHHT